MDVLCDDTFRRWAANEPDKLFEIIESGQLTPAQLTFAAEHLGRVGDQSRAAPLLLKLLEHEAPIVREGAIYGIQELSVSGVLEALKRHTTEDIEPSPGVRDTAKEAVEWMKQNNQVSE